MQQKHASVFAEGSTIISTEAGSACCSDLFAGLFSRLCPPTPPPQITAQPAVSVLYPGVYSHEYGGREQLENWVVTGPACLCGGGPQVGQFDPWVVDDVAFCLVGWF